MQQKGSNHIQHPGHTTKKQSTNENAMGLVQLVYVLV